MQKFQHDLRRGLHTVNPLGNKDTKALSRWIAEEKNIYGSLKTLDSEISANAKLISSWGQAEGDDLADVTQKMSQLCEEMGLVQQAYTLKHQAYRGQLKSIKVQELSLNDNRKKKSDLTSQIAKAQKSSKENPIKIMELQSALEKVTAELLNQEMELMQFKRVTIRDAFQAKFESILEYAEKLAIVAGYGQQITQVIDVEPQSPDRMRVYEGAYHTSAVVKQVQSSIIKWEPTPPARLGSGAYRTNIGPSYDEQLALSAAAAAYQQSSPYGSTHSPTMVHSPEHLNGKAKAHESWDEMQILKVNHSEDALGENGQYDDQNQWQQDEYDDHKGQYPRPPPVASNGSFASTQPTPTPKPVSGSYGGTSRPPLTPQQERARQEQLEQQRLYQENLASFSPSPSASQQHYQAAAAGSYRTANNVSPAREGFERDTYGGGRGPPNRRDTTDVYPNATAQYYDQPTTSQRGSSGYPGGSNGRYSPASYQDNPYAHMGFSDPAARSRWDRRGERMDNSDLYKAELSSGGGSAGTPISQRYGGQAPPRYPVMDEK